MKTIVRAPEEVLQKWSVTRKTATGRSVAGTLYLTHFRLIFEPSGIAMPSAAMGWESSILTLGMIKADALSLRLGLGENSTRFFFKAEAEVGNVREALTLLRQS